MKKEEKNERVLVVSGKEKLVLMEMVQQYSPEEKWKLKYAKRLWEKIKDW